jgi:hypothetical protein
MLKITPSQLEHIEMADCCYFIRSAHCRIRVMKEIMKNLDRLVKKASRFKKPKKEGTDMACGKGKKKGKKGGKK